MILEWVKRPFLIEWQWLLHSDWKQVEEALTLPKTCALFSTLTNWWFADSSCLHTCTHTQTHTHTYDSTNTCPSYTQQLCSLKLDHSVWQVFQLPSNISSSSHQPTIKKSLLIDISGRRLNDGDPEDWNELCFETQMAQNALKMSKNDLRMFFSDDRLWPLLTYILFIMDAALCWPPSFGFFPVHPGWSVFLMIYWSWLCHLKTGNLHPGPPYLLKLWSSTWTELFMKIHHLKAV